DAAGLEVAQVRLERGRVHRHEHLGLVPRGEDVGVGEVDLEARDAREGARRSADLGRIVRKGGEVVAEFGGLRRESVPGELHPVTGVSGEADDDPVELPDGIHQILLMRLTGTRGRAVCVRAAGAGLRRGRFCDATRGTAPRATCASRARRRRHTWAYVLSPCEIPGSVRLLRTLDPRPRETSVWFGSRRSRVS